MKLEKYLLEIVGNITEEELKPTEEEARLLDEISEWGVRSRQSLKDRYVGE